MVVIPLCIVFQHGIEDRYKLSHAGNDRNFAHLAFSNEPFVKGFNLRVVLYGAEHRHIQTGSNDLTPALNDLLTFTWATIITIWSHPD